MTSLCSIVTSFACEAFTSLNPVTVTETQTIAPTALASITMCPSVTGATVYVCPTQTDSSTGPSAGAMQTLTIPSTIDTNTSTMQTSSIQPITSELSISSTVTSTWSYTDTQTYYPDPYATQTVS